jgi:hypothetical protein
MEENEITDEYDREFISLMLTIEKRSEKLNKYDKLRIRNWCKKLCQVTNNIEWKKNRNLHAICILDSILNEHFEEPYNKFPPEGSVPILNKALVKSKLTKKFFEETLNMQRNEEKFEEQQNMENINENNEEYENENESYNSKNIINNKNLRNMSNYNSNDNQNIKNQNIQIINEQKKEINRLNKLLRERDIEIDTLIKEKMQMQSHIEELEQMIGKFMDIQNSGE